MLVMKNKIAEHVKDLLAQGVIDGFLALREEGDGQVAPYLFSDPAELISLNLGDCKAPGDARYPLIKVLSRLVAAEPHKTFGVLVRGCDERALNRLTNDDRVHPLNNRKVVAVGFSCPPELAQACQCAKPWPDALVAGEKTPGVVQPESRTDEDVLTAMNHWPDTEDVVTALNNWFASADRCIKCFGCRNVCPVCSCYECTIENEAYVPQRELPASRDFLMTRAMHMVDRCVYCGLCEQACPAGIPLKTLYRLVTKLTGREGMLPQAPQTEAPAASQEA
jgi:formate dehydrogenase subunit beta